MDEVILVNEADEELGSMEKMQAHERGLLHRAFSVFIFDEKGNMLLQRRAAAKYHSGGLWTNACCSHPRPGEETGSAARRRLVEELGFETNINKIFDFVYQASFENGLIEHEFDHVYVGYYGAQVCPDPAEVSAYAFQPVEVIREELANDPGKYTAWFHLAFPKIYRWWLQRHQPQ